MRNVLSGEAGKAEVVVVEGGPRIRLIGECDVSTAPQLREQVRALLDGGHRRVIFDLEGATFLDSSILTVFLATHRHAAQTAGEVVILCRPGFVRRLLSLLELDRLVKVQTPEEWRSQAAVVN